MTNTVTVKAIVKYNQMDGQQVLYYKTPARLVKMTNKKQVVRLHRNTQLDSSFARVRFAWGRERETMFIFEDEQPLLNGEPIELENMVTFDMTQKEIDSFTVGAKPVATTFGKSRNMNVDPKQVKRLRKFGWTLKAISEHLECSVATVKRKSA